MNKEQKTKISKKLYIICIITLIIIALLIPFVFANMSVDNTYIQKKQFFEVDNNVKTAGSIIEMSINLESITYDNFVFTLTNLKTELNVDTSNINEEENLELQQENNNIIITGNKKELNINEIKLYYNIPDDIEVGETITFKAEIEEVRENIETEDIETNIIEENNNEIIVDNEILGGFGEKNVIEVTITIVEKIEENNEDNMTDKSEQNIKEETTINNMQSSQNTNMQIINNIKDTSTTNIQTVTYKGSNNNYLENLTIEGHTLTREFSKENTTYFVTMSEETSLNIIAKAEDDDAIVCIYGEEDIKEDSKILISVTAENGNIRIYRIYITK